MLFNAKSMFMQIVLFQTIQFSMSTQFNCQTSPSDCLVSYPGYSLGGGSFSSAEVQSVFSTAPADWAKNIWLAPPNIQVDVDDLLQRARAISSQVQERGLGFNLEEVRHDQKRTVSVFVEDKRSCKIVKPTEYMVIRQLSCLGVKIDGTSMAFGVCWCRLLKIPSPLFYPPPENKDYIFRTEYIERRLTTVSIYEVPSFLRRKFSRFMLKFCDIVSASHDGMHGEWRFNLMLDCKTFYSIPNWLDLDGCRLPVIFPAANQPASTAAT